MQLAHNLYHNLARNFAYNHTLGTKNNKPSSTKKAYLGMQNIEVKFWGRL